MEIFTLEFWKGVWTDFTEFMLELPVLVLKGILDAVATIFESIPVPDFLNQSLGDALGPTMPYIGSFMAQAGLSQAFGILAAGLAFRLLRKALTLGQW
ncbi:MAG: hypothetical protein ACU0BN_19545 [Sulfitobacter sp.]